MLNIFEGTWALEILAWIRAVMYTCMWWDVRGGWWTKWTKSFFEGRLKIKIKINLCTHVSHCTYAKNTNNQCSVPTSAYVKQGGVVDKVDKELCGGRRAHAREHLPWERRHIRSSSAFQAAWTLLTNTNNIKSRPNVFYKSSLLCFFWICQQALFSRLYDCLYCQHNTKTTYHAICKTYHLHWIV